MQTFLPFSDIKKSLSVLDNKRLGKQRVEAFQIISAITGRPRLDGKPYKGWVSHPCSIMWKSYLPLLKYYYNCSIIEWVDRGFKNTMVPEEINEPIVYPSWWGYKKFHDSHKSNLLKKEPEFYFLFDWGVNPTLPYVWIDENGNWYEQHSGDKNRVYLNEAIEL